MLARKEIGDFLRDDVAITNTWQTILDEGKRGDISFEELAGRIDTAVGDRYEESFEQLSHLPPILPCLPPRRWKSCAIMPSAAGMLHARLAEGLRANKPEQIRDALEMAKQSRQLSQPD